VVAPGRRLARSTGALLSGAAFLLAPAGGAADTIGSLREKGLSLAGQEERALVDLYALGSRLETAQARVAGLQSRLAAVRTEQRSAALRLKAARRTLAVAERRQGEQLRALYEQDQPDELAILFGARSLEEVITGFEELSRAASSTATIVDETRTARSRVALLSRSLAHRRGEIARLESEAARRAAELADARGEQEGYVAALRRERRLNELAISDLEARARAARAQARVETVRAQAAPTIAAFTAQAAPPAPAPAPEPVAETQPVEQAESPTSGRQVTVVATGYTMRGATATGLPTGPGIVAVDPAVIPLGTRMFIPGYGEAVAADTGGAIKGNRIDIWFASPEEAQAWSGRTVTVTLY
jgi:3D (Asp-Asp-Asp) domain-containing protein